MAVIREKLSNGRTRYKVRVRDALGSWYPQQTFDTRHDAEVCMRTLLTQRDSGARALPSDIQRVTLNDLWVRWSADCRDHISDGWKLSQNQLWKSYIETTLGHRPVREVRPQEIGDMLNRAQRSRNLQPESVLKIYSLIHKLYEDAREHFELVQFNPVLKRYRPKVIIKERPFLKPDETWRLLNSTRDHWLGPAVWIMCLAGLRTCEIQALRVSSIDFERQQILIQASFARKVNVLQKRTKQGDWGSAPMPPALADYLKEQLKGKKADDFACPGTKGVMMNHVCLMKGLRGLCAKAKVPSVTPHELRHSCTEIYIQAGASAEDIRRLLNHKSLTSTARYIHRTDGRLQGIAAQVAAPVTGLLLAAARTDI